MSRIESRIVSRIASRASRFVASPLVGYRVIPSRLIALAVAIGAATPAAAPADPLNILPAATADAARTARFETVPVRYASAQGPNYGGGFLEFLMTRGGGAGPVQRPDQSYAPMAPEPDARRAAVDPRYDRQVVPYDGGERPGTIVIDTPDRLLYLVEPGGKAVRYGIGVGRPGFTWAGVKYVSQKREWPDWRPPDEMLHRRPDLPHFMSGGPENPLGARALYLGSSLYRIHGSNEPWTIGTQVSSGCIRMRNEDVIDLYGRVPVGAKVVVI